MKILSTGSGLKDQKKKIYISQCQNKVCGAVVEYTFAEAKFISLSDFGSCLEITCPICRNQITQAIL